MVITSQTPEGQPNRCQVCGSEVKIEPSVPVGDAPCLRCGHLLWFTWEDLGDIEVIKPIENVLRAESLDKFLESVVIRPGTHIVLDLTKVRFFSSAVFSKLINLKRRAGAVGGRFSIRNVHPDVHEAMRITHLDHVFDLEA
jgi:anti-anti-sigma factor